MPTTQSTPVFLLTFANEQPQGALYLRNLPQELSRLRATLGKPEAPYQLEIYPNMTVEELLHALRTQRNRIALWHYGGHSNSYSLLLQAAAGDPVVAHSGGLAKLLAHQHGLHLVFLNGCANLAQAQALLDAGIAVVVATSDHIADEVAMLFADHFYGALAADATIAEAFAQATATIEVYYGPEALVNPVPWQLLPRDEAAVNWRLADLLDDPCWGLPPLPPTDLPAQPFRYLAWFRAAHAELFFGRGQEIRTLYDRIADPTSAPIMLLYGQSGVGKSSLLDAGLLPRLTAEYQPYYVRRDRTLGLTQSLAAALCARTTNRTIPVTWRDHERVGQKPLVVILDQVEELFTRPQPRPAEDTDGTPEPANQGEGLPVELADLLQTLEQLFLDRRQRPQGKLILSFRKEYLAEIEKRLSERDLPYSKLFLEPLNERGLLEAITGVTRRARLQSHYGLTVEDGLPALIAAHLRQDTNSPLAPTLQILLAKLWERAVATQQSQPHFSRALYRELQQQGILLSDFFEQNLQALATVDAEAVTNGLLLDLLAYHTTPWGTAEQHGRDDLSQRYSRVPAARLARLIQGCHDHYLLVDPAGDQRQPVGTPTASRLAHDALAPLVRERFARSEAPGQRARRLLESGVSEWRHDPQGTRLDDNELALVEQQQAHMRVWTDEEVALVQMSQEARTARQQQARQQQSMQRQQRTIRRVLISLIGVALLVIGGLELRELKQHDDDLLQQSRGLNESAQQLLTSDPVASLVLAAQALPSAAQTRPYLPTAEFTLRQALNSSLERVYRSVTTAPLIAPQVALGRDWIAVNRTGLQLMSYNLDAPILLITVTTGTMLAQSNTVSWNPTGDLLLSQEGRRLQIWHDQQKIGQVFLPAPIACAAWQPTAANIAVCSGKEVALWRGGESPASPLLHFTDNVQMARWSPDGRWLVAWDTPHHASQQWQLWDSQTAQVAVQAAAPALVQIQTMAWLSDSQHLVISRNDGHLEIRQMSDASTQVITHPFTLEQIEALDPARFLTWGSHDVVRLWSVQGTVLQTFGNADDTLLGFRVSPDRTDVLVLQQDGTAWLYALNGGHAPQKFVGHAQAILAAAWHPAGQYLATSANDGTARVWDVTTGALLLTLRGHTGNTVSGQKKVLGVQWQRDGRLLTYGEDGSFRLWAIFDQQGLPLCVGDDPRGQPRCHVTAQSYPLPAPLRAAHWLDNDTIVTVDARNTVQRIDRSTGNVQPICSGTDAYEVWTQGTVPQQRWLFFLSRNAGGQLCDLQNGQWRTTVDGPLTKALLVKNYLLLSRPVGVVEVLDAPSGARVTTLEGVTITVAADVNPAGQLATARTDGLIDLWHLPGGNHVATLGNTLSPDQRGEIDELTWSSDGAALLATGTAVRRWTMADRHGITLTLTTASIQDKAQMSVDQQWVAIAGDQTFSVWHTTGNLEPWPRRHDDTIQGLAWFTGQRWPHEHSDDLLIDPLMRWFNSGSWWETSTRQLLLTWGGDGTARIWDVAKKTEIMRMTDHGSIKWAAVSPDGEHLFTVNQEQDGSSILRVWPLWQHSPEALLTAAQQQITRVVATEQ